MSLGVFCKDISFEADFTNNDFANIYLRDESKFNTVLYISLRKAKSVVAINACYGDVWVGEIARSHAFGNKHDIRVSIVGDLISLHVDEELILEVEDKKKFFMLSEMRSVESRGGAHCHAASLPPDLSLIVEPARLDGELILSGDFILSGWGHEPDVAEQKFRIEAQGPCEDLAFALIEDARRASAKRASAAQISVRATLPGRIWRGSESRKSIDLRLLCNERQCGKTLTISRAEIIAVVERLAKTSDLENRIFESISALEHVVYGRMMGDLSPQAQAFIRKVVSTFSRLDEFLVAEGYTEIMEGAEPAPALVPPPAAAPLEALDGEDFIRAFCRRARSEAEGSDPVPLLEEMLRERGFLSRKTLRTIFSSLAPHFCSIDRFEEFYRISQALGDANSIEEKSPSWAISIHLAFAAAAGDMAAVARGLGWLAKRPVRDAVSPAAIVWAVRHALRNRAKTSLQGPLNIEVILTAFMRFLERQCETYWGIGHNREFIDLVFEILKARPSLPGESGRKLVRQALLCHGLSRQFWGRMAEAAPEDALWTVDLRIGAQAFSKLERRAGGDLSTEVASALDFFRSCGTFDLARFRFELCGPFGVDAPATSPGPDLLTRLHGAHANVGEAVVRGLAFPGAGISDELLARTAARALRDLPTPIPNSPYYDLQKYASAAANTLIRRGASASAAETEAEAEEAMRSFLETLTMLEEDPKAPHVGLGLGLSAICGLLEVGAHALARPLMSYISVRLEGERQNSKLKDSRYVRTAYSRLRVFAEEKGDAWALAFLEAFPETFAKTPPLQIATANPVLLEKWRRTSPVFDTLVVVYSCQAYLGTRVAELRKGWLADLERAGIPFIVVVGGGNDELIGDVLYLNVQDNYDNLRHKTIGMIKWVHDNTPFAHLLKIDDDCYVNVDEYFGSLSWRKFNYYGRRIERVLGAKARTLRMARGSNETGRFELDKSPEPSSYADGGNGYALSRMAMAALVNKCATAEGVDLVLKSTSEDKCVGDLLAMSAIRCSMEDNPMTIYRRIHNGGYPVMRWENGFMASKASAVKVVHFDTHDDRLKAVEVARTNELWPKKIWPSMTSVRIGFDSKALDLVSSEARLAQVNSAGATVISVMRNEMFVLPRFLEHYRRLGVKGFLIVDNTSDDGTFEYLREQPDVALFSADSYYKTVNAGSEWTISLMSQLRMGRWSLVADADEFLVYPDFENLPLEDFLAQEGGSGVDGFQVFMLDMYSRTSLADVDFAKSTPFEAAGFCDREPFRRDTLSRGAFGNQLTHTSALRHRLLKDSPANLYVSQKTPLVRYRPWMRFSVGLHYATGVEAAQAPLVFAHFKYTAEFREKAHREAKRRQYFNNAEEYKRYATLFSDGDPVLYDPEISTPWRENPWVRSILEKSPAKTGAARRRKSVRVSQA